MTTVGLGRASCVAGHVSVPGSKSVAQRRLLLAGAAHGRTSLTRLPRGADVTAARAFLARTGASVRPIFQAALEVDGLPPGPHRGWRATEPFEVGESGTLARLGTSMLALAGHAGAQAHIEASGTLLARSSAPLFATLREAGVAVTHTGRPQGWPVSVRAIGPPSELWLDHPVSSQELSALLCAVAAWPGEFVVRVAGDLPSRPYAELTARELRRFGAQVEVQGSVWSVRGPLQAPSTPLVTEVDASAAAVALAAGAITGRMVSTDLTPDSGQGDARIVEHLRAFGAEVVCEAHTTRCRAEQLAGVDLDLADTPDLAPVLAAVAIVAALRQGQSSTLRGLRTLNRKESRRLDALVALARTCGCSATAQNEEVLVIGPASGHGRVGQAPASVLVDAQGDHRLAFAGALLGLALPEVLVQDAGAVAKSWPSFWSDFATAGGILIGPDAALASSRFGA